MKELEDYNWFPAVLRNFQTEFIGFVVDKFNAYEGFIQHLNTMQLAQLPMTDLCSGSGNPAISIYRKSNCFSSLKLTDKFPSVLKMDDAKIHYEMLGSDVLEMEFKPTTYYTPIQCLSSFHG